MSDVILGAGDITMTTADKVSPIVKIIFLGGLMVTKFHNFR